MRFIRIALALSCFFMIAPAQAADVAPATQIPAAQQEAAPVTPAPAAAQTPPPAAPKAYDPLAEGRKKNIFDGWLGFFFPSLRTPPPDPMKTLQAPFATSPDAKPPEERPDPTKVFLPENSTPLDLPHRDNTEISGWLTNAISEALTFDKESHEPVLASIARYFTAAGNEQYLKFLTDNNVIKVLQSKKFQVRSFVLDAPLLLNEGAVNGSYRWLYEVPVMLSYMEYGVTDYKKLEPINQKIVLTIQVGRTAGQKDGMAILIERWDGKAQRMSKK